MALTVDELLRFDSSASINAEVVRRLKSEELFTKSQVETITDHAYREGSNEATPDAIDFIYRLMDGEHWRENLDDDTREWIKTDLLMLLLDPDD